METIKVFLGMEIGRYDGCEYGKVLKTYANGTKLVWLDHENDDENESWDELWLAQKNPYPHINAEWYGIDSENVRVNLDDYMERRSHKDYKAEFNR